MTEKEILRLDRLETEAQLDYTISLLDQYLDANKTETKDGIKLTDLIYEYEERTDILNPDYRLHEQAANAIRLLQQQYHKKIDLDYLRKFL